MAQNWGFSWHFLLHIEVLFKITHPVTPLNILSLTLHYRLKQSEDGLVTNSQDKASAALTTPPAWLLKLPKAEKAKVPGHCLPTGAASLYVLNTKLCTSCLHQLLSFRCRSHSHRLESTTDLYKLLTWEFRSLKLQHCSQWTVYNFSIKYLNNTNNTAINK